MTDVIDREMFVQRTQHFRPGRLESIKAVMNDLSISLSASSSF